MTQQLKLKQASAALGVPPKDLQNLVQFGVVRPRRRGNVFWFDFDLLLQAKVAFYLRESLGASSDVLAQFCAAVSRELDKADARSGSRFRDISLRSRPRGSKEAVEIKIPLRALAEELQAQLPRAAAHKDLPRGRKRPGWKKELLRAMEEASAALAGITEQEITSTIRKYRSERKKLPEIAVIGRTKEKKA